MDWTLPQRLYLLSYDLDKNRLDPHCVLVRGQLMRAAAVAELVIDGLLKDHDGKAKRNTTATPPSDPFLTGVLHDAPPDKPHRWFTIVDRGSEKAEAVVRKQLETAGTITVRQHRILGLFPIRRTVLNDRRQVNALRENTRNAALLARDPATVPVKMCWGS